MSSEEVRQSGLEPISPTEALAFRYNDQGGCSVRLFVTGPEGVTPTDHIAELDNAGAVLNDASEEILEAFEEYRRLRIRVRTLSIVGQVLERVNVRRLRSYIPTPDEAVALTWLFSRLRIRYSSGDVARILDRLQRVRPGKALVVSDLNLLKSQILSWLDQERAFLRSLRAVQREN